MAHRPSIRPQILEISQKLHIRFQRYLTTTFITCDGLKKTGSEGVYRGILQGGMGCLRKEVFAFLSNNTHGFDETSLQSSSPVMYQGFFMALENKSIGIYFLLHYIFCGSFMPTRGCLVMLSSHYQVSTQGYCPYV